MTNFNHNLSSKLHVKLCFIVVALFIILTGCDKPTRYDYIEGETMGTSYHIRYRASESSDAEDIKEAIDARLIDINNSMSTYQQDSLISAFNSLSAGQTQNVDDDFIHVFKDAKQVYKQSDGAFDPTVMPLIELWGFGRVMTVDRLQNPPSLQDIEKTKQLIDFNSIELSGNQLTKTRDGVGLDFSAIAKGYGVDTIADVLNNDYKINDYMVEIGGEVATAGLNQQNKPWQIAIDAPVLNSKTSKRKIISVLVQPSKSQKLHLATSGNYRNSVVFDGIRYSHTIDPTTGQPIVNGAPSVSVVADSVSIADAWATALTAMPYKKALKTATKHNIAALFIIPSSGDFTDDITERALKNIDDQDIKTLWKIVETPAMQDLRAHRSQ